MSWTLEGVGSAGQTVSDVTAAAEVLDGSVERSRRAFGSNELAWVKLKEAADRVRAQMLDGGCQTVARGLPWSLALGGVYVQLIPRSQRTT